MEAHLAINDGGKGEVVEDLGAVSPHGDRAILAEALVVEAVHLGDLPRLVVPSDQGDPVWVPDLGITKDQKMFHLHSFQIKAGAPF